MLINTNILRFGALLWVALALVGCSGLGDVSVSDESNLKWAARQQQLREIDSWEIHGRTAIFVEQEVYQAGINWQRDNDLFVLGVEAPFGRGVFRIESGSQSLGLPPVKLSMPDGRVYYGDSADSLLTRVLGWSIPVSGLKSWIKGLPLSGSDYNFDLLADGRLRSLRQDGWLINYLDYFSDEAETPGLPRKMYLKHPNLALKIVIERWRKFEAEIETQVIFPDFDQPKP